MTYWISDFPDFFIRSLELKRNSQGRLLKFRMVCALERNRVEFFSHPQTATSGCLAQNRTKTLFFFQENYKQSHFFMFVHVFSLFTCCSGDNLIGRSFFLQTEEEDEEQVGTSEPWRLWEAWQRKMFVLLFRRGHRSLMFGSSPIVFMMCVFYWFGQIFCVGDNLYVYI